MIIIALDSFDGSSNLCENITKFFDKVKKVLALTRK
jgi:hypothetical protein